MIGLGVGEAHLEAYRAHPACEVVAICDFSAEKQQLAHEKYPDILCVDQANIILTDPNIDVISIASFDNYHMEHTVTAIENGKHVFVEKPFCLSEIEARAIKKSLTSNPHLRFSSNLILRCCPRFIELKKMIGDTELGQISYIEGDYNYGRLHKITNEWRGQIPFYSVVYGGGLHLVDLMLWLTGDKVIEVSALGNKIHSAGTQYRYNDTVIALLKFSSGAIGKVGSNYGCVYPHFHTLNVYGTKATYVNGLKHALFYTSRNPDESPRQLDTAYPGVKKGELVFSFIESILHEGKKPLVTSEDAFQAMAVCFAIEQAVKEGNSVVVRQI